MSTEQRGTEPDDVVADLDTLAEFEPDAAEPTAHEWLGLEARGELQRLHSLLELVEPTPQQVGRYRIERVLGRGGMGVVHLARDPELDRHVALKLVHAGPFADEGRLEERLRREARALAQLKHPNIVEVYDVGRHEGQLFVAMEYVDGPTLRSWRGAATRSSEEIVAAYVQAGRGLAAVHRAGIIHRDFKPDNVLIDRKGRVVVGDFGLADDRELASMSPTRLVGATALDITRTGALMGTLRYMAHERLSGEPASKASDQFEFCTALWEALTGVHPFARETRETREALLQAMSEPPRGGEALDRRVRRVLERGLARVPEQRYASLDELLEQLEPTPPRWRGLATFGLVGALGVALGVTLFDRPELPEPPAPPPCELGDRFAALEQRALELPPGTSASARAAVEAELARAEQLLRGEVADVCATPSDDDDLASARWLALLEHVVELADELEVTRTLDNLAAFALEHDRVPPIASSPQLAQHLDAARDHLLAGELEQAQQSIAAAATIATTRADQAELMLRRGQLAQRRGEPTRALEQFAGALRHADVSRRDHDRLILHWLSADVALREARDVERGLLHHHSAADLIERLELPDTSPLRIDQRQHDALVAALVEQDLDVALAIQAEVVARREAAGNPWLLVDAVLEHSVLLQQRMASEARQPDDAALALADHRRVLAELDRLDAGPRNPLRLRAHYNIALLLWDTNDPQHADEIDAHVDAVLAAGRSSVLLPTWQVASAVAVERWQADPSPTQRAVLVDLAARLRTFVAEPDHPPIDRLDAWSCLALVLAHLEDASGLATADAEVLALVAAAREQGVLSAFEADYHLAAHALQLGLALEPSRPELAQPYLLRIRELVDVLAREHPEHPEVASLVAHLPASTTH